MTLTVHLGVVWAYHISNGWFRCIKAFPDAVNKKGEPDLHHPSVMKYIREKTNA